MLLTDFQFSQNNLQDYVDCQRRFQLRYALRQAWPAVDAEPILEKENFLRQGAIFHRLVQQHLMGLPIEKLIPPLADPDLRRWWANFREKGLLGLPEKRHPEIALSIRLAGYPLVSRYDLIAIEAGKRAVIVDWKTARHRPPRRWLENRLQTRLYRYLLVRAGTHLNGGQPIPPEQVEMIYWFTNFPDEPEHLRYSSAQFQADEGYLTDLLEHIISQDDAVFPLTADERPCRFCTYRTLCERGERAGTLDEEAALFGFTEDFDAGTITELEF
jgi:hypothetical protein